MEATRASFERKHTKALLLLKEATTLDPEFAPAWMSQGKLYEALELNEKARECYEEVLTIYKKQYEEEPENIDRVKDYAEVLWLLGEKKKSLWVLNQAIRKFPEDKTLLVFKKMILKTDEKEINRP